MSHRADDPLARSIEKGKRRIDGFGRMVHFIFGAAFGGVIALVYSRTPDPKDYFVTLLISAVAMGLTAAILGDKFWKNVGKSTWRGGRM